MSQASVARRAIALDAAPAPHPSGARRALEPAPRIARRHSRRLGTVLAASALALLGTVGVTVASTPQTTAHGAVASVTTTPEGRAQVAEAVSRGHQDRSVETGPQLDDHSAPQVDQAVFEARAAELETRAAGVRDAATGVFMKRFAEQQAQRAKEPTKVTPKQGATPTDGFASLIYPGGTPAAPAYVAPVAPNTYVISSSFGATGSWNPYHNGQDFAAPAGTPVYAATDAMVGVGIPEDWPGTHLVLHLASGESLLYAHLTDSLVKPGQIVHAGDLIGHVGNTGRSFGAHLHFEYYPSGTYAGDFWGAKDSLAWLQSHGVTA